MLSISVNTVPFDTALRVESIEQRNTISLKKLKMISILLMLEGSETDISRVIEEAKYEWRGMRGRKWAISYVWSQNSAHEPRQRQTHRSDSAQNKSGPARTGRLRL